MKIISHSVGKIKIAEIVSDKMLINNEEDGKDLIGNLYYSDFDKFILYESNINPKFFDLKNGLAGEILQKFSNFRIRLAIVGEFDKYESKSLQEFIYESNKGKQVNFLATLENALISLSK